jgi:enoyl-CoA hydratase
MLVKYHDEVGGVRVVTFDRPPANAITTEFLADLKTVIDGCAAEDTVRAVLVRGNAKFFSAGLDLKAVAGGGASELSRIGENDGINALWTLPKPTVAQVEGHAIAGGAILALACDLRLSWSGPHKIGVNESAFGIAFPREAFEILRTGLPAHRLGRAVLEGTLYPAAEALENGFLHECLPDAEALSSRSLELARQLATSPAVGYAYNKRLLLEPALERCAKETDESRQALVDLWSHPDTVQGIIGRLQAVGSGRKS